MKSSQKNDVIISGVSCRLPKSKNMNEFKDNLMNGVDMVTDDGTRWKPGLYGLPTPLGRIDDIDKFDAAFFGLSPKLANCMDPQLRMLLEVTYEAIVDAGVDPSSIRGQNVGVYTAVSCADFFQGLAKIPDATDGYGLTGSSRAMFANRISYCFDFKGPSNTFDTACSAGLSALHFAVDNIRTGKCDAAVVCGANICLSAIAQVQFLNAGLLSPDGRCKSFDASGNGYVRSEGIVSLFLQRSDVDARRIYCTVVNTSTNCDGYKQQGISYPSSQMQADVLTKVYSEVGVDPSDVEYVESHGTGTAVGDPIEANVITDFFCPSRTSPLKIGSLKSNIGHGEAVSGLASIAKVLIAMECGVIPANLHLKTPNPDIHGLADGRLKVITKNTPWNPGYVGVNSFGFGGSNVHVILKPSHQSKHAKSIASSKKRLIVSCSRTKVGLENILNCATKSSEDFHLLMNETMLSYSSNTPYRGYTVLNGITGQMVLQKRKREVRPVWYVFAGMGSQRPGVGKHMMEIDAFRESILRSENALKPFNFKLLDILTNGNEETFSGVLNSFVSIVATQIALVDVLSSMNIIPDGILGHSVGELACGYADGSLTAEETMLLAYWRGLCVEEAKLPPGAMAAVGLNWNECMKRCPPGVVPACHNSRDMVTISGPVDKVRYFVERLSKAQVYSKEISSSGVAFHSYFMKEVEQKLRDKFEKVLKSPRRRSKKWISSSLPEDKWNTPLAEFCSADYHVNNVINPVLFYEALRHVPRDAIVIEIAPASLLQASIKRTVSADCFSVGLMKAEHQDPVHYFLSQIGDCFNQGLNLNACGMVTEKSFPVPRGTPMLSPHLRWDHSESWDDGCDSSTKESGCDFDIDLSPGAEFEFLSGHIFDERIIIPAACYLILVWKTWAKINEQQPEDTIVSLRDVRLYNAVVIPKSGRTSLSVKMLLGSMMFEITNGDILIAKGEIQIPEEGPSFDTLLHEPWDENDVKYELSHRDVYKELRLLGQSFEGSFKKISSLKVTPTVTRGTIKWDGNWISFLDNMLQCMIFPHVVYRNKFIPQNVDYFYINPKDHMRKIVNGEINVQFKEWSAYVRAGGLVVFHHKSRTMPRRVTGQNSMLQSYEYIPYGASPDLPSTTNNYEYVKKCSQLALGFLGTWFSAKGNCPKIMKEVITKCDNGFGKTRISESEVRELSEAKEHGLCKILAMQLINKNNQSPAIYPLETLGRDIVYSQLINSGCIKLYIDTVCENLNIPELPIVELCHQRLKYQIEDVLASRLDVRYTYKTGITNSKSNANGSDEVYWPLNIEKTTVGKKTYLLVADNVLHAETNLTLALSNIANGLMEGGFVLVKETTRNFQLQLPIDIIDKKLTDITDSDTRTCAMYCDTNTWLKLFTGAGFEVVMQQSDPFLFTMFLLRKRRESGIDKQCIVDVTEPQYGWVDKLKADLSRLQSRPEEEHLWLVARDYVNGVVGLINCLRKEPGGERLRCVQLAETQPAGPKVVEIVRKLAKTDMAINVQNTDGEWGCYRHVPLNKDTKRKLNYAFVNPMVRGDLSSLNWVESQLKFKTDDSKYDLCRVHYSALNFRDVMLATGKLDPMSVPEDLPQDCPLGMEFAGITSNGCRIMGLVSHKGMATAVEYLKNYAWEVPSHWTLEEACTVPVAYTTAYYALVCRGNIKTGERVLIHAGSGGVGQAAIAIALSYNCEIFTTVSSEQKKEYLMSRFPELKPECFYNSRDVTFEQGIERVTNHEGCDIILNSLADDKMKSSLRLLAKHGRFLEIGKYDLMQNTPLGMGLFMKNVSFHGILTDMLYEVNGKPNADWSKLHAWLPEGIKSGVVRPLSTTVFDRENVEAAFRYMAQGKHIGKILIKVLPDGSQNEQNITGTPRFYCEPNKRYIVHGGLGGFGLELTKWLAERGAKYITVTSRSGITNGYQRRMIYHMRNDGVDVVVSNLNLSRLEETQKLLSASNEPIGGIFNLAMVLEDGLLINQTPKTFQNVCEPKVDATINLDRVTRDMCKNSCDWFVCFSSASSGFGNKGQSNYAFANSTMERICEQRKADRLHGLAIQWGAIGDVGVVYDSFGGNDAIVGGTLPQLLPSCFSALELFLSQSCPVVSSHIPADKDHAIEKSSKGEDLSNMINRILGITEHHTVKDDVILGDIGLDSLMAVEIQQAFERLLDIHLHTNAIRHLTLQDVRRMSNEGAGSDDSLRKIKPLEDYIRLEDTVSPSPLVLPLNEVYDSTKTPLYIIHTLEGVIGRMTIIAEELDCPVFGIQCTVDVPLESIQQMSKYYIDTINQHNKNKKFHLCGFSYGSCVAVEMAMQMEQLGLGKQLGCLILLDGSHKTIRTQAEYNIRKLAHTGITPEVLAFHFFIHLFAITEAKLMVDKFLEVPTWDDKVDIVLNVVKEVYTNIPEVDLRLAINRLVRRLYISLQYEPSSTQQKGVLLVKGERELVQSGLLPADYGLSETFLGEVKIHSVHGNHLDFFEEASKRDIASTMRDYLNAD